MTQPRQTPRTLTVSVVTPDPDDSIRAMLLVGYDPPLESHVHLLTADDLLTLDRAINLARRDIIDGALLAHEAAAIKAVMDASGGAA